MVGARLKQRPLLSSAAKSGSGGHCEPVDVFHNAAPLVKRTYNLRIFRAPLSSRQSSSTFC